MPTPLSDRESRLLINKARILGGNGLFIYLEDHQLLRLALIAVCDLNEKHLVTDIATDEELAYGYFKVPLQWFDQPVATNADFVSTFHVLKQNIDDFPTYFEQLCALHKRRLKYTLILEHQPFPQLEQIVPRCLLEYGLRPAETLASLLVWRKWLYDIDNRSAQETGYLFEPILAAAIGGISYSASKSPIKRTSNPQNGRQVDCLDGKQAYEFKMRVTIAASGQGRFQEELSFARDCFSSGYSPTLLVLDPTPSTRLNDLKAAYAHYAGTAYIGDEAWKHIEEKAGNVMGTFVEKYIRTPLKEVENVFTDLQPMHIGRTSAEISIDIGTHSFSISRGA